MSAKDLIIDFINLVFFIALICLCLVFVISGNNFGAVKQIMAYLIPIALLIFLYLIKLRVSRRELKKRTDEGNLDMILRLSYTDKIIFDIILFLTPIIILLVPLFSGMPNPIDLLQALIVFLVFFFWLKYIFSKDTR